MTTAHDKSPQDVHRQLEHLAHRLEALTVEGKVKPQKLVLKLLKEDLLHHLRWEEEHLFAEFDRRVGLRSGPTRRLRAEHAQLELSLRQMAREVDQGIACELVSEFRMMLEEHGRRELSVLYPVLQDSGLLRHGEPEVQEAV